MKTLLSLFLFSAIFLLSFLMTIYENSSSILGTMSSDNLVTITLNQSIQNEDEAQGALKSLASIVGLDNLRIIPKSEQYADFVQTMSEDIAGLITSEEVMDVIPVVIEGKIKSELSQNIIEKIKKIENIEQVKSFDEWIQSLKKVDHMISLVLKIIFLLFFLIFSFLTAATTRSLLDASKNEIEIYSFLGAAPKVLYKKYLTTLGCLFFLGFFLGLLFNGAMFFLLKKYFFEVVGFSHITNSIHYLSVQFQFILFIGFAVAFLASAHRTLKRTIVSVYLNEGLR